MEDDLFTAAFLRREREEANDAALLEQAEDTLDKRFDEWVHTPHGGKVANKFIRLAIGLKRGGFKTAGAKAIVERLRWHFMIKTRDEDGLKCNNNYTSRLARFAEERCPELKDFFKKRSLH